MRFWTRVGLVGWVPVAGLAWSLAHGVGGYGSVAGTPAARDLVSGYLVLFLLLVKFGGADDDAGALRGSARMADRRDLRGALRPAGHDLAPGEYAAGLLPGGAAWRKREVVLSARQVTEHVAIVGPPGAGKSRTQYMPNVARAAGSFVVTDPKGELWRTTAGRAEVAVVRFAPTEPDRSAGFNWIPCCRDARVCSLLAEAAMQRGDGEGREQPFWANAEQMLTEALFAFAAASDRPTPATVYAVLTGWSSATLLERFARGDLPQCQLVANHCGGSAETLGNIMTGVIGKLKWLADADVQRFTSSRLEAPHFWHLTQRATGLYWVLHENDVQRLRPLSAVFFTLLLDQVTRPQRDAAGGDRPRPVPVTLFLDEFANLGRLPGFATTIAVARGRGVGLVLGLQALSQLGDLYGRAAGQTILTCCATKLYLHGLDPDSAEWVSRSLGEATVRHRAQSGRDDGHGGWAEQAVARRLMTADEVRRLPDRQLLMVQGNRYPLLLDKAYWSDEASPPRVPPLGPALAWTPPPEPAAPARRRP